MPSLHILEDHYQTFRKCREFNNHQRLPLIHILELSLSKTLQPFWSQETSEGPREQKGKRKITFSTVSRTLSLVSLVSRRFPHGRFSSFHPHTNARILRTPPAARSKPTERCTRTVRSSYHSLPMDFILPITMPMYFMPKRGCFKLELLLSSNPPKPT